MVKDKVDRSKVDVLSFSSDGDLIDLSSNNKRLGLKRILAPVIFVAGCGPNTNKFEVQLTLRKHFADRGYSATLVGSKEISSLFGSHPLPDFLFETESVKDKIIKFNRVIYKYALERNPM